jgi:hypothetical protein
LDDESEQRGNFTYENLTIENCRIGRDPLIQMACTSPKTGQAGHFRNVTINKSTSKTNVVDLGGGPRNKKLENGVAYYFHGYPAAGETTKVVSAKYPGEGEGDYGEIKGFTGPNVRATVVKEPVAFPTLLSPVDDLPPATMIRSVRRGGEKWVVTGLSHDNGEIVRVTVNGRGAQILSTKAGVVDWMIELPKPPDWAVTAAATDAAGNGETLAHRL